jgi:hypothetical protein
MFDTTGGKRYFMFLNVGLAQMEYSQPMQVYCLHGWPNSRYSLYFTCPLGYGGIGPMTFRFREWLQKGYVVFVD